MADIYQIETTDGTVYDINDITARATMTGATASENGTTGRVPAPSAGDNNKYLRGDGTWGYVSGAAHTIADEDDITYTPRSVLKIVNATITDDSTNDATVVEVSAGGLVISTTAPDNVNVLWIDISNGDTEGIAKYYINGAWTPCKAVWG